MTRPLLLLDVDRTGAELAWATTWGHRANRVIGPALGLPWLRVVEFAGPHADTRPDWKFPAVARHAYGRPLAWLDDDFDLYANARDAFLAKRGGMPTVLVPVDPATGLTPADLAAVERRLGPAREDRGGPRS